MQEFVKPEIPPEHLEFAKAVGRLAAEHGIQKATFSYLPHWDTKPSFYEEINGKLKINVKTRDGRGRPAMQVFVSMENKLTMNVE